MKNNKIKQVVQHTFLIAMFNILFCIGLSAQTKTCKFNITNNTGETLNRSVNLSGSEDFEITSGLPLVWNKGETHTLTFEANVGAYYLLWLSLDGELPSFSYSYSGGTGGPYNLEFSTLPRFINGQIDGEASKCMIADYGRLSDIDPLDVCKGGNESGKPLFCVNCDNSGLDVSLTYGVSFLHYDKTMPSDDETTSTAIDPVYLNMQFKPENDPGSCITSSDLPWPADVNVRPLDYDPGAGQIVPLRTWAYDLSTQKILLGDSGTGRDYCLGAGSTDQIKMDKCNSLKWHRWFFDDGRMRPLISPSLCLTRSGTTDLKLTQCQDTNTNQKWIFSSTDQGKVAPVKLAKANSKCIDTDPTFTTKGTNVRIWDCGIYAPSQTWIFENSSLKLGKNSNFCLDLNSSGTTNGNNVQLWDCNGTDAQKWVYDGLTRNIRSKVNSEKCLDLVNGITSNNNNIQIWDCKEIGAQQWTIDGATTVASKSTVKHIVPVLATGFAVHSHTGAESGSNIQLWTKDNINTAEQWYFDGLAIKMRDHQNLCIDLSGSNTSNGSNIQLYNCNDTNAQKWIYDGMTKSIRSVVNPDKCMQITKNTDDVYGKRSNVEIQDCSGSAAQQFLIQE